MPTSQSKLRLPQISKVKLRHFSLYAANPDAEFDCGDGVLCIIGANGLGKSTLLSAVNFCLTGIVSDPGREFKSMPEYYEVSRNYAKGYFRGRISENDSNEAEITLDFRIGDFAYVVKRGLFEPEELRALTITNLRDNSVLITTADETPHERQRRYETLLIQHIGLSAFDEFVFLQHFVFTFDERRITLFWNQKILERVLYLAFGLRPDMATKVDELKREYEKADSQVRNRQWDSTKTTKRINDLRAKHQSTTASQQTFDAMVREQERLTAVFDEDATTYEAVEKQLKDANLRLATLSARESALRDEYAQFFERGFEHRPPLAQHPLFTQGIAERRCGLCGASGVEVAQSLQATLDGSQCPLCNSSFPSNSRSNADIARLQKIDQEITQTKLDIRNVLMELKRLGDEELLLRDKKKTTKDALDTFERQNESTILVMRKMLSGEKAMEALLSSYRSQLEKLLKDKEESEERRAKCRLALVDLQRELQRQYLEAEQSFVPVFTELAHLFLGMDLQVRMEASESSGLNFVVDVRGTPRRQPHQLSESQKFFLDIALRMALTQFVSHPEAKGGLFIDTPEGSLDIAYEKRAGDMLAKFVTAGHRVMMTANLNSSQLLLALARSCKRERMRLCRMTDWAELSDVQREEEELFDKAYEQIERAIAP